MNVLNKISKAVELIKSKDLKKKGYNNFSKYDYYTPDQVSELTTWACHEVKIYPKFDLVRNELGIFGRLSIYDLETDSEPIQFEMASAIPDIKATNVSQQLGGAVTYTKRYMLMNAFDITDNNLDFDTPEKHQKEAMPTETLEAIKNAKSLSKLTELWNSNKKLHSNQKFIKLLSNQKKLLKENGISN